MVIREWVAFGELGLIDGTTTQMNAVFSRRTDALEEHCSDNLCAGHRDIYIHLI